jgi:lysozyme
MQKWNSSMAKGLDASHWQGIVNFEKAKADGISFAFLKATQGTTFTDDCFAANVRGAKQNGILVGAYHYLNAGTAAEANAEAKKFVSVIRALDLDLPPVLDIENGSNTAEAGLAFLRTVEGLMGIRPIVYTFPSFIDSKLASKLSAYPLWYAYYNSDKSPRDRGGWTSWEFLQYSDRGAVKGISNLFDVNVFNGSVADLQAKYGKAALTSEVANIVVNMWLSPAWFAAKTNKDRDYIHWLAEEVRRAARILPAPASWKLAADTANVIIQTWLNPAWFAADGGKPKQERIHGYANALRKASGQSLT